MKKIIEGKLYNTETARFIAKCESSNCSDFSYFEESLYITKKGQYFIYGEGGPRSEYAIHEGNSSSRGSDIILVDSKDILKWLEEKNSNFRIADIDKILLELGSEIEEG